MRSASHMAPPPRLPPRLRKTSLLAADPTPLSCLLASRAATKDRRAAPPLHWWHVAGLSLCSSQDRAHLLTRNDCQERKALQNKHKLKSYLSQTSQIPSFPFTASGQQGSQTDLLRIHLLHLPQLQILPKKLFAPRGTTRL